MVLGFLIALWIFIITLLVLLAWFWLQMLAEVSQRKFPDSNEKLVWLGVVGLTFGLGAAVYYFSGRKGEK